jgi:hypothetical protein
MRDFDWEISGKTNHMGGWVVEGTSSSHLKADIGVSSGTCCNCFNPM